MLLDKFPQQPSILVIDDEPDNFDVIEGFLFAEGYQLSYAASAASAFKRLQKHLPDLILLDVMMPEIDGIEFCRQFKRIPEWQHIPIIMITALGKQNVLACLQVGADDFISKPVNSLELKARIISMLRIKFQYDALKGALRFRDDLTDMIIHDFVNPLSSILLQTELMQQLDLTDNIGKRIHKINRSATRLHDLTNDLLLYAKAEANQLILRKEHFNVNQVMSELVADFEEIAQARAVIIHWTPLQTNHGQIIGDRPLFLRMLSNLVSNALKFSNFNTDIHIEMNLKELEPVSQVRTFELKIKDQGQCIDDAIKEKIFQKYEIGKRRENVTQTGLGLAFCKMVVEAHNGTIQVSDNQPQGSIFTIQIPL